MLSRRNLFVGLASALAMPAIVKAENIMKIASPRLIMQELEIVEPKWIPVVFKLIYEAETDSLQSNRYTWKSIDGVEHTINIAT